MRDRLTAVIAILLLGTLIGMSYWYSVRAKQELIVHLSDFSSPDFISQDSVVTRFDTNGEAKDKLFATNVKHYSDGHATGEQPHYYSITTKSPQITARSDFVDMVSGGEVFHIEQCRPYKPPRKRIPPAVWKLLLWMPIPIPKNINLTNPSKCGGEPILPKASEWIMTTLNEPSN